MGKGWRMKNLRPVIMTPDPTYVREQVEGNPIWKLAWTLSEVDNDNAPIGWGQYIPMARWLLETYRLESKG